MREEYHVFALEMKVNYGKGAGEVTYFIPLDECENRVDASKLASSYFTVRPVSTRAIRVIDDWLGYHDDPRWTERQSRA